MVTTTWHAIKHNKRIPQRSHLRKEEDEDEEKQQHQQQQQQQQQITAVPMLQDTFEEEKSTFLQRFLMNTELGLGSECRAKV